MLEGDDEHYRTDIYGDGKNNDDQE